MDDLGVIKIEPLGLQLAVDNIHGNDSCCGFCGFRQQFTRWKPRHAWLVLPDLRHLAECSHNRPFRR